MFHVSVKALFIPIVLLGAAAGCARSSAETGAARGIGDVERGAALIRGAGCGSCHTIPGIRAADGVVGPPLFFFSRRTYIAGQLPNTPENLVRWIRDPQAIEPGTAMPSVGLDEQQARDVAAYLYTLR